MLYECYTLHATMVIITHVSLETAVMYPSGHNVRPAYTHTAKCDKYVQWDKGTHFKKN